MLIYELKVTIPDGIGAWHSELIDSDGNEIPEFKEMDNKDVRSSLQNAYNFLENKDLKIIETTPINRNGFPGLEVIIFYFRVEYQKQIET